MRWYTIAAVIAAVTFQFSNIGIVQAQNATEKLALGMPITMDDLRGQEFIGRITAPNTKNGYSVRLKFDSKKPVVEVIGTSAGRIATYGTNFDEPTLTAATGFDNGNIFFNFKTMEATAKDGANGMIMHADFGCWFRDGSFGCPKHVSDALVNKYKATFEDLKSENKSFIDNSKTLNTAEAYLTIIKPRLTEFGELSAQQQTTTTNRTQQNLSKLQADTLPPLNSTAEQVGRELERAKDQVQGRTDATSTTNQKQIFAQSSEKPLQSAPKKSETKADQKPDLIEIIIAVLAAIVLLIAVYFIFKWSKRCPKCKENWSWKIVHSFDSPSSTFQAKKRTGEAFMGGNHEAYIYTVTTYETGLRTTEYACDKCGHEKTNKGSYKKMISVRRQNIWRRSARNLAEFWPRLGLILSG